MFSCIFKADGWCGCDVLNTWLTTWLKRTLKWTAPFFALPSINHYILPICFNTVCHTFSANRASIRVWQHVRWHHTLVTSLPRPAGLRDRKLPHNARDVKAQRSLVRTATQPPVNHFTPKFEKYILPTFYREMYKWCNLVVQSFFVWISYEKPSSLYCVM